MNANQPKSEVDLLKQVIIDANAALCDTSPLDVEHDISSHADTLPERYRSVAGSHARALEILQGPIREWIEGNPTPASTGPAEKTLPDAPGYWIVQCDGEDSQPYIVHVRIDEHGDRIDDHGIPVAIWPQEDRLCLGPLTLPWEKP